MARQIEQNEEIAAVSGILAAYPLGTRATSEWEPTLAGEIVGYCSQGIIIEADSDGRNYVLRVSEIVAL